MNFKSFFLVVLLTACSLPALALAQSQPLVYKALVGIPTLTAASSFGDYINALYGLSIAVAALMAVIKIIIAGVKYMLSDVVTNKQEAIGDIRGSLLGLLVVISAVLVLTIINPQLTKTTIFIDPYVAPATSTASTVAIPATIVGNANYTYRPTHPDPGFKNACTGGKYYSLAAAGRYEVCYDALPTDLITALEGIFRPAAAFNFTSIVNRYQTAHRPRMTTSLNSDTKKTEIANVAGSKNRNKDDVFLVLKFYDGSRDTPPVYLDWIDLANIDSIDDTCFQFSRATNLNVRSFINATDGYMACVSMP